MSDHPYARSLKNERSLKSHKCCVCDERKVGSILLHTIPKKLQMRSKWENAVKGHLARGKENLSDSMRICSDHFLPSDYIPVKNNRLKKNAVPSQFPAHRQENVEYCTVFYIDCNEHSGTLADVNVIPDLVQGSIQYKQLESDARELLSILKSQEYSEKIKHEAQNWLPLEDSSNVALGPFTPFPDLTNELYDTMQTLSSLCDLSGLQEVFLEKALLLAIEILKECDGEAAVEYLVNTSQ